MFRVRVYVRAFNNLTISNRLQSYSGDCEIPICGYYGQCGYEHSKQLVATNWP